MAQTKKAKANTKANGAKANTKAKGAKAAAKKAEVISDLHADFETANGSTIELDLYDSGSVDKSDHVKITAAGAIVIYCKAVVMDDYAFLSWPSFKSKDGDYINTAFCFDKDINEAIGDALTDYYFSE